MSVITDVLIFPGGNEWDKALLPYVRGFRVGAHRAASVEPVTKAIADKAGGSKVFTETVYAGAFNYLAVDEFVAYLRAYDWNHPERWVMVLRYEHDEGPSVYWQAGERSAPLTDPC